MQAISASMTEGDLTATSCTVGFVGADSSFTILSDADLEPHVAAMKDVEDAPAGMQATSCFEDQLAHDIKESIGFVSVRGSWDVLLDSEAKICTDACSLTLHVRLAEFMHKCCSYTCCLDE